MNGPAVRHRVSRVNSEVEDHQFEFAGIDLDRPQLAIEFQRNGNIAAEAAIQQFAHPFNMTSQIDRLRV